MTFPALSRDDEKLFYRCCAVSLLLHVMIMILARAGGLSSLRMDRSVMEIDLSIPLGSGGHKKGPVHDLPPKPLAPAQAPLTQKPPKAPSPPAPTVAPAAAVPEAKPEPEVPAAPAVVPEETPKVAPATAAQPLAVPENAVETPGAAAPGGPDGALRGTGTAPLSGGGRGYGEGTGDGAGTGQPLDLLPRLLNREELLKNLRKYYPESERRAGREGAVVLKLEIGEDGGTVAVEVMDSAGRAFDEAARKVARTMRFSPAMRSGRPVAVRVPQRFIFQLE